MIHVCSLARLHDTVRDTGARHVVTLIKDVSLVHRPATIPAENHLLLDMDDITDHIEGYVAPAEEHVGDLLRFVRAWDRAAPLVVHCYAGISRSTAGAFVTACALNPNRSEAKIAQAIRAASPTATPNLRIVRLADQMLGRRGRMVGAIEAIGPGMMAYASEPFRLDLE
jgi:predicted protein tyrosine phosphatase